MSVRPDPFSQLDRIDSVAEALELACHLEVLAPKLGNVHPAAAFSDVTYEDFLLSGQVIAGVIQAQPRASVGELIFGCVDATLEAIGKNTNLGIILLTVPICLAAEPIVASDRHRLLRGNIENLLQTLTPADSCSVYQAIGRSKPGGLGKQDKHDVAGDPPDDLISAMRQVAHFDFVARQYVHGFEDIFDFMLPTLRKHLARSDTLTAIVLTQLDCLARWPDGLIIRKCGGDLANQAMNLARAAVIDIGDSIVDCDTLYKMESVKKLDDFLRSDGNRLNPGTTADLIAATLLCYLLMKV